MWYENFASVNTLTRLCKFFSTLNLHLKVYGQKNLKRRGKHKNIQNEYARIEYFARHRKLHYTQSLTKFPVLCFIARTIAFHPSHKTAMHESALRLSWQCPPSPYSLASLFLPATFYTIVGLLARKAYTSICLFFQAKATVTDFDP